MYTTPHVASLQHLGASPYAPILTPAQQHAAERCAPIRPPLAVIAPDVWILEDRN